MLGVSRRAGDICIRHLHDNTRVHTCDDSKGVWLVKSEGWSSKKHIS